MNLTEIIKGNKLIAEFYWGNPYVSLHPKTIESMKSGSHILSKNDENNYFITSYQYHLRWSDLMPIVEAIEQINDYSIEISNCRCRIFDTRNLSIAFNSDSKILATWFAVIEFIKWYNKQNNK